MGIAHVLHGKGEHKVLALHGWFGSARGWGPMVDALDGDAFTYAFMDNRGYGARKAEGGPFTMEQVSADALKLADDLGWKTFSVMGHSMGGMAVQRVLVDGPARVRKLVAITPVPASGVPFDEEGWGFFSSAAESRDARAGIIDLTTGNRLTRTWIQQVVQHSLDHSTREAFAGYLVAWARTDFAARVKGNPVPLLVLPGAHDPALGEPVMQQTFMQWFPNATLQVVQNAGHYPMFETPVALATAVEKFLAA